MISKLYIPFNWDSSNFQDSGIFTFSLKHLNFFFFECFLLCSVTWFFLFLLQNKNKKYSNLTFFIFIYFLFLFFNLQNTSFNYLFNKSFIIDNFTISFKFIMLLFLVIFLFFIKNQIKNSFSFTKDNELLNYFLLIFFFLIFLLHSFDLISFFITIESSTFILVALVFLQNFSSSNKEAGFKFFFLHALASSCFILAILIFLFLFKTTNYLTLLYYFLFSNIFFKIFTNFIYLNFLTYLALVSIFFFLMFKFSIFPCHFWIDSFYEGSPILIVLFFSTIYKFAIICFYFKIFFFLFIKFDNFFFYFIIFSIMYGSHLAFLQKKIKRYWAFSTINNFGFFFFSTIFCNYFWGLQIGAIFLIVYFIMTFFFFIILFFTRNILTGNFIFYISQFSYFKNKYAIWASSILFLSLAGIPPFIGFFSKFFIFSGIIFINFFFIICFFIFYSLISAIYYLRILKQIFFLKLKNNNFKFYLFINYYLYIICNFFLCFFIFSFFSTSYLFKISSFLVLRLSTF